MKTYIVSYMVLSEGNTVKLFRCQADDSDHAIEQCKDAEPHALIAAVSVELPCVI